MVIITDDTFKYNVVILKSDSDESKFIKDFFNSNTSKTDEKMLQIYKVVERKPTKSSDEKRNNLMLFHGTCDKGVDGILKEGFKNSEKGWFGKGVYMTDCSSVAFYYSRGVQINRNERIKYVFVNEVLKSEMLEEIPSNNSAVQTDKDTKPKYQFEKHVFMQSVTGADYKEDALGRRYSNIPINSISEYDQYLADESITIPRYLIEIEETSFVNIIKSNFK